MYLDYIDEWKDKKGAIPEIHIAINGIDKFEHDDLRNRTRNSSNQMKTLIVMQILGNTKTFFDTQSTIVDTNVNEYLNKTIEDQYGLLFDMAQGQTMENIINGQY